MTMHFFENKDPAPHLPILEICGCSGAGKTTLIENLVPGLRDRGFRVAVVKQTRELNLDTRGKDSDRLFQAGADVIACAGDCFYRAHSSEEDFSFLQLNNLSRWYDLILVEGSGQTSGDKIWLLSDGETEPPSEVQTIAAVYARSGDLHREVKSFILSWLEEKKRKTPVWACVLIGGKSSRMGQPKHLLVGADGRTWLELTVEALKPITKNIVLSGAGQVPASLSHLPRLVDLPDVQGPMTGIMAAMRWHPIVSWLLVACDMPYIKTEAITWLLNQRQPGNWGVVPSLHQGRGVEPLLAWYDYRCASLFEQLLAADCLRIGRVAEYDKVCVPLVPEDLHHSWRNVNSPGEV